jgi:hypothetical protein
LRRKRSTWRSRALAVARRLSIPAVVVAISVRFSWLRVWMESSEELD